MTSRIFDLDGPLGRALPGYRVREPQREMAKRVEGTLGDGGLLLVEAPCGVGKSFGYLVPAILHAVATGETVVVSTGTLSLQDQLVTKDLPTLKECLGLDFRFALAKGRANYFCQYRIDNLLDRGIQMELGDRGAAARKMADLEMIAASKASGPDELGRAIHPALRSLVVADPYDCGRGKCPRYQTCHLYRARTLAREADIVVTNHSLYLTEVRMRAELGPDPHGSGTGGALPDHEVAIFDEGHHLPARTRDHFSEVLERAALERFARVAALALGHVAKELRARAEIVRSELEAVVHETTALLDRATSALAFDTGGVYRFRGRAPVLGPEAHRANTLSDRFGSLADGLRTLGADADDALDFAGKSLAARGVSALLALFGSEPLETHVHYARRSSQTGAVSLVAAPAESAEILGSRVFPRLRAVVLTSATLATGPRGSEGSFDYARRELGTPDAETLSLESPFLTADHAITYIARDLPNPNDPEYPNRAFARLAELLFATDGRALVLFASLSLMAKGREELSVPLSQRGIELLVQGDAPPARLLERFRERVHSVLFASATFWEGIDVPGEALSCVAIVKLPFSPPTEPVTEERLARLSRVGRNGFFELSLPEAIQRMKQGVGRLIRTETDRGVVAILDPRMDQKSYGRLILAALPPYPRVGDLDAVRAFLALGARDSIGSAGARKARDRGDRDREALPTGNRDRSGGSGAPSPSLDGAAT